MVPSYKNHLIEKYINLINEGDCENNNNKQIKSINSLII